MLFVFGGGRARSAHTLHTYSPTIPHWWWVGIRGHELYQLPSSYFIIRPFFPPRFFLVDFLEKTVLILQWIIHRARLKCTLSCVNLCITPYDNGAVQSSHNNICFRHFIFIVHGKSQLMLKHYIIGPVTPIWCCADRFLPRQSIAKLAPSSKRANRPWQDDYVWIDNSFCYDF